MERTEDLEQQIWEFIYGLLPESEAERLNRRITSEPHTARLYAEVKLQADLLAEAARLDEPPISWARPPEEAIAAPAQPADEHHLSVRRLPSAALAANWLVGLAAALLLCVMGYDYLRPDSPINGLAVQTQQQKIIDRYVQTTLWGPQTLQPTATGRFIVATRSASGRPRSVRLKYKLFGDGERLLDAGQTRTAPSGLAQIETPDNIDAKRVRLEVAPDGGASLPAVEASLPVGHVELTTHLRLDKPLYRPGETVRFRSLTLSRFGLQVLREVAVEFRVLNSSGSTVPQSLQKVVTEHGVGHGEFAIPGDQPAGKYTLVAASPSGDFAEARREFYVRPYRPPHLQQQLKFARDRFALPKKVQKGQGRVSVTVDDQTQQTIGRPIPVNQGDVSVEFFPESGDLVAGVENRVYFRAHDSLNKPVHVEGRIVDSRDHEVAVLKTAHEGRGRFRLTPRRGESYRLEIDTPSGVAGGQVLPATSDRQFLTLNAGAGVFDAGQPIPVRIHSTRCDKPLALTAVCRGVVAGQQIVSRDQFVSREAGIGTCDLTVPLAQQADGVIRLTAYDLSVRPPQPVAERLVYRRPAHKLNIQVTSEGRPPAPGDQVKLGLLVRDENGQPQQAVLGLSVVDDARLALAGDQSPHMTTHFWLTSQIDRPEELEDANFYLEENEQAAAALDLVLATQGWRRFAPVRPDHLARADTARAYLGKPTSPPALVSLAAEEAPRPVVLADNDRQSRKALEGRVQKFHTDREFGVRRTGQIIFAGGVAVLIALVIMGLLRMTAGVKLWLPAVAAASVSLIVGSLWMDIQIDVSAEVAALPRAPESAEVENVAVAEAKKNGPEAAGAKTERLAEQQDESIAETVEKEEAAAMPEEPEPAGRTEDEAAFEAAEPAREAVLKKAPAPAARPAPAEPAPTTAARSVASADRPAPAKDLGQKAAVGGEGLRGGFGGGGFARGESKERPGAMEEKRDGMKARLPHARSAAESGPAEREMRRKAAAVPMAMDAAAESSPVPLEDAALRDKAKANRYGAAGEFKPARAAPVRGRVSGFSFRDESGSMPGNQRFRLRRQYSELAAGQTAGMVRPAYPHTLLWQPLLIADANGRASVQFTLPEAIASFRVLVDGHADGRIGSAESKIISQAPSD